MKKCVLLLPLLLAACSPPRPPERRPASERAPASGRDLRELVELSQLVVVGAVQLREESEGNVSYRVRVDEILADNRSEPAAGDAPGSKPEEWVRQGSEPRVTSFLYRVGRPAGEISRLKELARYVFFLTPTETSGEWLNLADPAVYVLPAASDTVEALRAQR